MSHRFPKNQPKAGWPIDALEINENLREVGDELSGRLNEHNVGAGSFIRTDVADGAILDVNNTTEIVDPDLLCLLGGDVAGQYPRQGTTASSMFLISNSAEWAVALTLQKGTANSLLWAIASFQQQLYDVTPLGEPTNPGCQYALRVDGTVIDETVIGGLDRSNDPRGEGLMHQAGGFATDAIYPVSPGIHTIDLVVRSVRGELLTTPAATTFGRVLTRELILLTLDPHQSSVSGAGPVWSPLQEGDNIGVIAINAPFTGLRTEFNALDYTAFEPESLHAEHMSGVVVKRDHITTGTSAAHTYTNTYPGVGTNTVGGSPAWAIITQGGNPLSTTFAGVNLTTSPNTGVLVMCEMEITTITNLNWVVTAGHLNYVVFVIQAQTGGVWRNVAKTQRYTNAEWRTSGGSTFLPVRKNLSIRTFLRDADLTDAATFTGLRVVVSTISLVATPPGTDTVEVVLEGCSLNYAILQAGT